MSDNNNTPPDSNTQASNNERLFADVDHSFLNPDGRGGSLTVDEFFGLAEFNGFTTDESILPTADELFRKTPPEGGWTWSEGWGEKKLKEVCKIVKEATNGHYDEARSKVFRFAQRVGGGAYDEDKAREKLIEAARQCYVPSNATKDHVEEVIRAFNRGVKDPQGPFVQEVPLNDFYAYLPTHEYIFRPTGELWPLASVNSLIPSVDIKAGAWLDQNRAVEQTTWAPGEPELIEDRLISQGGWFEKDGVACYNLYKAPVLEPGDATKAEVWVKLVREVFPAHADWIIKWFAHRVQHPADKINHALVMGSDEHGIGKDTIIEPVRRAVGSWNFSEETPVKIMGRFNRCFRSVILRINEARDLGDMSRFQFYDHMKTYLAAPPLTLDVEEKYRNKYVIPNCVGVIITTNYKNSLYLPAEDRRHYVAWSDKKQDDFSKEDWDSVWAWYGAGGYGHVTAYLAGLDLTGWDAKAPPPKTDAFWEIVDANRSPEEGDLDDALFVLKNPKVVTIQQILGSGGTSEEFHDWLKDRKNCRTIPQKFKKCGYSPVMNRESKQGLWRCGGKKQMIYGKVELTERERLEAVEELIKAENKRPEF
jgi:hypothetical protein